MSTPPDEISDEQNTQSTNKESQEPEQASAGEQATADVPGKEQPATQERSLPPEAQGETHGGPLGCCLGAVAGIFLMALLTTGIPLLLSPRGLPGTIALPLSLIAAIPCGYLGWQIGKRIYREYELSPRQKQKLAAWENRRARKRQR